MGLFDRLFDDIVKREGGYSNHQNDSGGETRFGITKEVATRFGYVGQMSKLPVQMAKIIYLDEYWLKPGFDQIAEISAPVAEELFDTGVNMGVAVAGKMLQRSLNVFNRIQADYPDLKVDGQLGDRTKQALYRFVKVRGLTGTKTLVKAMNCLQGCYYIELAERREKDESFVYGWLSNRVNL